MKTNKDKVMWEWIQKYDGFNKLFYNFGIAEDGNTSYIPTPNDYVIRQDILGTKLKYYDFAITSFKDITMIPYSNENMTDYSAMQGFIDWVIEMNRNKEYPDFGEKSVINNIEVLQNMPNTTGIDNIIAKYMIQCRVIYEEYE